MKTVLSSLLIGLATAQSRPNILFLFIDDLGWNDVGFNGASDAFTPFIDKLAQEESLILSQSYAQHYCTQSRSSLLSGRYPIRMGLQHRVIEPAAPYGLPYSIPYPTADSVTRLPIRTLPDILSENGYQTHLVGKWHLGFAESAMMPQNRGFDSFYGFLNGEGDHYYHWKEYKDMFGYDLRNNSEAVYANGNYSSYLYGNVTQDLLKDIASKDDSAPFFIELAFQVVHSPNESPATFKEAYDDLTNEKRVDRIAMSTAVDSVVEQLTQTLKSEGLWDNTFVVFQSDNGGAVTHLANNYPLRGGKFSLFEGGVRTVTFVTGGALNNNRRGQTMDQMMHISDWMPTFIEMAGITNEAEYLGTLDGVSQLGCIQDGADAVRDEILHNLDPMACNIDNNLCGSIRKGPWKLSLGREVTAPLNLLAGWVSLTHVEDINPTVNCNGEQPTFKWDRLVAPFNGEPLLFNVIDDPCEYNDLSQKRPIIRKKLMKKLIEYNSTMMIPAQLVYPEDAEGSNPSALDGFWGPWLDGESVGYGQAKTEL